MRSTAPAVRCRYSTTSRCRSRPVNSSRCSARAAAGSRRCCASSRASTPRGKARSHRTACRSNAPIRRASSCSRTRRCTRGGACANVALGLEARRGACVAASCRRCARARRAAGIRERVPASVVRRDGAAGRAGPRARQRSAPADSRRAARQARFAHAAHDAGRATTLWQRDGFSALLVTHDVEEALFLAQRVIVFGPRPARIVAELRRPALPAPSRRPAPRRTASRRVAAPRARCELVDARRRSTKGCARRGSR